MVTNGFKRWQWVGGVCLALLQGVVVAQEQATATAHLVYTVQQGDNLSTLAARYLRGGDALAQLVRINQLVNPDFLGVGQTLKFPKHLLQTRPSEAIVSVLGCQQAVRRRGDELHLLQIGDGVREGDVLSAPVGCPFALSLEESSSVHLQSGSTMRIKAMRVNKLQASPQVDLELQSGRVEVQVPRKRPAGDAPFEIRTSTSLAGIRGTELRVGFEAASQNSQVEVLTGRVGALGRADRTETTVGALQGLSIPANGRALAVETLPGPARYVDSLVGADGRLPVLQFQMDPHAAKTQVVWSQEANATRLSPQTESTASDIPAPVQEGQAAFMHVRGVTASGLEGAGVSLGVCRGYLFQRTPRCDVRFDVSGAARAQLTLTRQQTSPQVLFNAALPMGTHDQAVLRGLWDGVYHWTLTQVLSTGERIQREGQFQLVALPATHG